MDERAGSTRVPLEYGHPPKRRWVRHGVIGLLFLAALYIAVRWVPPVTERLQFVRYQRQCLNYKASPDKLVFEQFYRPSEFPVRGSLDPTFPRAWPARAAKTVIPHCIEELQSVLLWAPEAEA